MRRFLVYVVCLGAFGILITLFWHEKPPVPFSSLTHSSYSPDASLYAALAGEKYVQKFDEELSGGIVSHHLLTSIDIAEFFAEFSDQEVNQVFLVGPNHYYPSASGALTTNRNYSTPFGEVALDRETIADMHGKNLLLFEPSMLEDEHSMSSLVPYIAKFLPKAMVVPLVLSARASESDIEQLAAYIAEQRTAGTIVVASVDFSHHLQSNAARLHDARSIAAIQSFDKQSLSKLELDSPQSIRLLLSYLERVGAQKFSLKNQSASQIFADDDAEDVTSYVFAHARKGAPTPRPATSILFFGDAALGRGIVAGGKDPFTSIRGPEGNFLKGHDAVMVNLEGALAREDCGRREDELLIEEEQLSWLQKNRVSHVGIMNNHFMRCPLDEASVQILKKQKLEPVDDQGISVEGTGSSVALIAYFASPVPSERAGILARVRNLAAYNDAVVVNLHWGIEYSDTVEEAQRTFAHELVDAGATMILGHGPHVIQQGERYKNGIIFYSVGNFIFDQLGEKTKEGIAVGFLSERGTTTATLFPYIQKGGIPTHILQKDAHAYCKNILGIHAAKTRPCEVVLQKN